LIYQSSINSFVHWKFLKLLKEQDEVLKRVQV
jgi:hypothetical protein